MQAFYVVFKQEQNFSKKRFKNIRRRF